MSIPNIIYKIKRKSGIDINSIMFLLIIVGVGIGSFGLGRMSVNTTISEGVNNESNISEKDKNIENISDDGIIISAVPLIQTREKRYVASKNGKIYYSIGCSGISRIKLENQIWFSTKEDAEKSGYTLSTTCH